MEITPRGISSLAMNLGHFQDLESVPLLLSWTFSILHIPSGTHNQPSRRLRDSLPLELSQLTPKHPRESSKWVKIKLNYHIFCNILPFCWWRIISKESAAQCSAVLPVGQITFIVLGWETEGTHTVSFPSLAEHPCGIFHPFRRFSEGIWPYLTGP